MNVSEKKKPLISIAVVMACTAALLIACIVICTQIVSARYQGYTDVLVNSNRNVLELAYIRDHLSEMDTCVRKMLQAQKENLPEIEATYDSQYQQACERLNNLYPPEKDQAYYFCRDLLGMFATYHEEYLIFRDQLEQNRQQIYLNSNYETLKQIARFISDKLNDATSYSLNIFKTESSLAYERVLQAKKWQNAVVLVCILLCAAFTIANSLIVCLPISALKHRMEAYTRDKKDTEPSIKYLPTAEVDGIKSAYLAMIHEIDRVHSLEVELYRQQMHSLELDRLVVSSELKMLQMQMNPHFLFNALNTIHALSQIGDSERTGRMVEQLSEMLRYSMHAQERFVALRDECKIIDNYVSIQKVRFDDRIVYHRNVDEKLMEIPIPRMILQPLIENAIIHGFDAQMPRLRVELTAKRYNDGLRIAVADDGRGMNEEKVAAILNGGKENGETKNVGLNNVLRRIELLYGEGNVQIESAQGKGTRVVLLLGTLSTVGVQACGKEDSLS